MWREGWILCLLPLFGGGCSQSTPLLVSEPDGYFLNRDDYGFHRARVGAVDAAGGKVKLMEEGKSLGPDQVALINSILPVYRAVVRSDFLKAKKTGIESIVLNERNGTLEFWLRNSEYFSVKYTSVRPGASTANHGFVTSSDGDFQIWETGVWVPRDR